MNQQPTLFDSVQPPPAVAVASAPSAPVASHPLPDTRREAARAIEPAAADIREAVLNFIASRASYGSTDEEACHALKIRPDTARARRCELRDEKKVLDSGHTRPTTSGRQAIVWVVPGYESKPALMPDAAPAPTATAQSRETAPPDDGRPSRSRPASRRYACADQIEYGDFDG